MVKVGEVYFGRYRIVEVTSKDRWSKIVKAEDNSRGGKSVALRIIGKINLNREKAVHALREIAYHRLLKHENVISLEEVIGSKVDLRKVHLQFPPLDCTLEACISTRMVVTKMEHKKRCLFHVLNALSYVHSAGIVHFDLRPENILVDVSKLVFRISNFMFSRHLGASGKGELHRPSSETINCYSAPEVAMFPYPYQASTDIWSVGCIMYELFDWEKFVKDNPRNADDYASLLFKRVGLLKYEDFEWISDAKSLAMMVTKNVDVGRQSKVLSIGKAANPMATSLIQGMLQVNPERRYNAESSLTSEFFKDILPWDYETPQYENPELLLDYLESTMEIASIADAIRSHISFDVSKFDQPR